MKNRQLRKATSTIIEVLSSVENGVTMAFFSKTNGYSAGYVSRLFKRQAAHGFIRREYRSSHVQWVLTKDGQKILEFSRRSDGKATSAIQDSYQFRWEHLLLKSEWLSLPAGWDVKLKEHGFVYTKGFPRGGGSWQARVGEASVLVTRKSVMYLVRPVSGESPTDCVERCLAVVLGVRAQLERDFEGRLSFPERLSVRRQEIALVGGMTRVWPRWFGQTDRVKIDNSHGPAEIETTHPGLALEDMNRILEFQDAIARGVITVADIQGLRLPEKKRDWRDLA